MSHSETAHRWAAGNFKGSSSRAALWFEGDTIYSWGRHWPIARLVTVDGQRAVILNGNRYSNSTSKHTLHTRRAVSHLPVYNVCRAEVATLPAVMTADEAALAMQRYEVACVASAEHAREERNARARQARARRKEALLTLAERLEGWRNGKALGSSLYSLPVAVRLSADGRDVETSHGARVRLRDALRLFKLCRAVKDGELVPRCAGEMSVKVGPFELRGIDADGDATVGCHKLAFAEMSALFDRLTPEQRGTEHADTLEVAHV